MIFNHQAIFKYESLLNSIIDGFNHRIVLLDDGYIFDNKHTLEDVLPYIAKGSLVTGYPINLKAKNDILCIKKFRIENIEGAFYGAVCFNEAGLIFYIQFNRSVTVDGSLNISTP